MLQIFYILNMLYLKYVLFHEGTSCTITNSYKMQLPVLLFLFVLHQLLHQQISLFFASFFFLNMLYFNFLTVLLIQICKIQPPVLFSPFVLYQLSHQQILLFTSFQNFIQNYLEKDFRHRFSSFNRLPQTLPPP